MHQDLQPFKQQIRRVPRDVFVSQRHVECLPLNTFWGLQKGSHTAHPQLLPQQRVALHTLQEKKCALFPHRTACTALLPSVPAASHPFGTACASMHLRFVPAGQPGSPSYWTSSPWWTFAWPLSWPHSAQARTAGPQTVSVLVAPEAWSTGT